MNELQTLDRDQNIYGIDYLGQGKSWPVDCDDGQSENERDLSYSIDTWVGQVLAFIEDVVIPGHGCDDCKVHLVGNSVGGHLATILAASRPDLVRSVSLLNATPVWGLGLPGWNGRLPAPAVPKQVGRFLFDKIRDFDTIQLYLGQAYSRTEAFDDDLIQKIQGCTEGKGGHAAFGSIVWSSPSSKLREEGSFSALVSQLECDVLLLFGDDDEWCKPAYAKHMMKILKDRAVSSEQQPVQRYLALSNTGHCPNHEAPQSVAHAIARWVSSEDGMRDQLALIDEGESTLCFHEPWGDMDMREVDGAELEILSVPDKIMIKMLA